MSETTIQNDLQYLAGTLHHRGSNTENERAAADYIRGRLRESIADVETDAFRSTESYFALAAAYYGEFSFVAIVAYWFPWAAFIYGFVVFMAYLAEVAGYSVSARMLLRYDTQNVVARLFGTRPRRLVIVTAHCDSPKATPLARPAAWQRIRWMHLGLVSCMVVVLASCVAQGAGLYEDQLLRLDTIARWTAVAILACAAVYMLFHEFTAEYLPGAIDNASGLAALLEVGERLRQNPPEGIDVWLVATGSAEGWLNGMRRLFQTHTFAKAETFFINLDAVGDQTTTYITGEGLLHLFRTPRRFATVMRDVAASFDVPHCRKSIMPSEALVPLARGFDAVTISSTGPHETLPLDAAEDETFHAPNVSTIVQAAAFTEAIIRELDSEARK